MSRDGNDKSRYAQKERRTKVKRRRRWKPWTPKAIKWVRWRIAALRDACVLRACCCNRSGNGIKPMCRLNADPGHFDDFLNRGMFCGIRALSSCRSWRKAELDDTRAGQIDARRGEGANAVQCCCRCRSVTMTREGRAQFLSQVASPKASINTAKSTRLPSWNQHLCLRTHQLERVDSLELAFISTCTATSFSAPPS